MLKSDEVIYQVDKDGLNRLGWDESTKIGCFIDNELNAKVGDRILLPIVNPSNNKILGHIINSNSSDVDLAVASSLKAQPLWSSLSSSTRSNYLNSIADLIESKEYFDLFCLAESLDSGKTLQFCKTVDIPRCIYNFRFFAKLGVENQGKVVYDDNDVLHYTKKTPIGVAGLISPWNLPLYLLTWKIAPCIMSGSVCICKPSEVTSLTANLLCKVIQEVGLPKGVVNMVFGLGKDSGAALCSHPSVSAISFTGGTSTGKTIATLCAPLFKKVSLELGGKNPSIILPDCDLDLAIRESARAGFSNQGQICLAMSRIYVHESIYQQFIDKLKQFTLLNYKVGNPQDINTKVGALSSHIHRDKVLSYIELAKQEGGTILCGGDIPNFSNLSLDLQHTLCKGAFINPTIITDLDPLTSKVIKEEIFGPVITITSYSNIDEAIRMANDTPYGLASCVWGKDLKETRRVAHSIKSGLVWINCWLVRNLNTPFGGMKQSGLGREGGKLSLEFYTETTTITIKD